MQKLLKAVEMGLYTGVLCIELERLSRGDGADQQRIPKAFQKTESGAAIEPTLRISLKI